MYLCGKRERRIIARRCWRRFCVWRGRRIGGGCGEETKERSRLKILRPGKVGRNELRPYSGEARGQGGTACRAPTDHQGAAPRRKTRQSYDALTATRNWIANAFAGGGWGIK